MRSLPLLSTVALIAVALLFPVACKVGLDRQHHWDMARAENRCAMGYAAYCVQLSDLRGGN